MPRPFHPSHPFQLVLGPIIWAVWFVTLYATLSVTCNVAPPAVDRGALTWLNGALLILTVLVTVALAGAARWCWRASRHNANQERFFSRVAAGIYLLMAVSTLLGGLPIVLLPPCP